MLNETFSVIFKHRASRLLPAKMKFFLHQLLLSLWTFLDERDIHVWQKLEMMIFLLLLIGLLSFLVLVYRLVIIFSPYIRAFVLRLRYRRVKRECIEMVIGKSYVGDWFLIYLMGQNIDSVIFKVSIQWLLSELRSILPRLALNNWIVFEDQRATTPPSYLFIF